MSMSDRPHKIRVSTTKGRETFEIPADMSYDQFLSALSKLAKVPKKHLRLLTGFPPAALDCDKKKLARDCLAVNETVVVRSKAPAANEKVQKAQASSSATAASSPEKQSRKRDRNVNHEVLSKENRSGARKMVKVGGDGRTLSGKVIPTKRPSGRPNTQRSQISLGSNEGDVAATLLSALNSGGSGNKIGRFLRGAMRGAVGKSYEASRAQVRVAAVDSNNFKFLEVQRKNNSLNGLTKVFTVKYSKGLEGRGNYNEEVDIIELETLKAVIQQVFFSEDETNNLAESESNSGREMLRPVNMAQLSPRVFWSLAYHFEGYPVISSLKRLLPDLDWRYLYGRAKSLSEKAKENLRQERMRNGEILDENEQANKAGLCAIESVEGAMIESYEKIHGSKYEVRQQDFRERLADVTQSRADLTQDRDLTNVKGSAFNDELQWSFVTPTDLDIDELKECIQYSLPPDNCDTDIVVNKLIEQNIRNWRELANMDSEKLAELLKSIYLRPTLREKISLFTDQWIEQAQIRSIDEIMMEIVDFREDMVNTLQNIKVGTPKDLRLWEDIPTLLVENITATGDAKDVSEGDAKRWCSRSRYIMQLEEMQWLDWFASDV